MPSSRFRLVAPAITAAALGLAVVVAGDAWRVAQVSAQEETPDAARNAQRILAALAALRDAVADRDPGAAERFHAEFLRTSPGADARDEGALLLGRARVLSGRYAEAAEAVREVVARKDSPWSVKALYLTAEAAARRRSFAEAAEIYAERVAFAGSDVHRAELAALHREVGDAAWDGDRIADAFGKETRRIDWATAATSYAEALALAPELPDANVLRDRIARARLETGAAQDALDGWTALLAAKPGDLADDAAYGRALALLALNRRAEARDVLEALRRDHGDSPFAPLALLRTADSWIRPLPHSADDAARAVAAWRTFLDLHPSHAEAPATSYGIGEFLAAAGSPRAAADAWRDTLARFPEHPRAAEAQHRVAQMHLSLEEFDRATAEWQTFLRRWPDHALWAEARAGITDAAWRKALAAVNADRRADARAALDAFLAGFAADPRAGEAQRLLGELDAKDGAHGKAIEAWKLASTKYRGTPAAPDAAFRIAETYEGPLADLEKALAAYQEVANSWPSSSAAARARTILAEMKGKQLVVSVPRPFRTDEPATVSVKLRNVPRLRMKAYRLRLDEYVARKGGLDGFADVAVDAVKPDHEWDWTVPEYGRYRLLERPCPLPVKGPGTFLVTAADDELTATFLATVTDLTAIVKASDGGTLVFVANERTGEPVAGARVVVHPDVRGVTGADGVWTSPADRTVPGGSVVVTGTGSLDGHAAFAAARGGGTTTFGYATKAFLWTDRPVYRPAQTVHLRAVVRRVESGRYVTEERLPVRLTVTDPRGATLLDGEFPTDAFGFVATDLSLATEPALGTCTATLTVGGRTFTQSFDVMAYRKPEILADVVPSARTAIAGDRISATASLRWSVGGKASGVPVRWAVTRGPFLFDASAHDAFAWFFRDAARDAERARIAEAGESLVTRGESVTDANGDVVLSVPTSPSDGDATYVFAIEAQDPNRRWIRATAAVPVTAKGVHVLCRTEKKTCRPGETVTLDVTTVDPLHVPVATEGRAVLVRRRVVDAHTVEDVVVEVPAKTGADGHTTVALKPERAGDHVLRFVGKDARGRDVSGETPITVAGDAEDLAKHARLIADREFYREGDVAKVLLHVPEAPCPVLLTWEGERVLEHRVLFVKERSTTVDMPLRAEHAPNVFLRMAAARNGRFHEDGDEVAVFQYLDVKVEADPTDVRPGGKVRISVTTTDQSGRPVRAQVGVDVVDAAILAISPDRTAQVKPFFYDQRRTHGVRSGASCGALPATTRPTNQDLLFEQMRRLGKARYEEMESLVREGRQLLEAGNVAEAEDRLRKALEIAPGNHEVRALLARGSDLKSVQADKLVAEKARKAPGAPPPPTAAPAPAPRPMAEAKDAQNDADGAIGTGGGAGGGFGRRQGGRASLRAGGGGGKKGDAPAEGGEMEKAEFADHNESSDGDDFVGVLAADPGFLPDGSLGGGGGLAAEMPVLVPAELRRRFEDTAWSSPSVRTGEDGRATVEIDLPDNLTEWRVTGRGASVGPLVGEGMTRFRTSKRLLVRPDAPRFLTQGDTTTPTGTVHSSLDAATDVTVRFAATGIDVTSGAETKLRIGPGEVRPVDAGLGSRGHGLSELRVDALTGVESDAAVLPLPVLPFGVRRMDGASGLLTEEAFAEFDLPERSVAGTVAASITVAPSADVALLESLAYVGSYPWGCVEQTVNRFLPALAARTALRDAGLASVRIEERLDEAVRRGLGALYGMQADDGSFGWFGPRSARAEERTGGDPEMTAYAVLAFVRAERAGFAVSPSNRERAVQALSRLVRGAPRKDRAFALLALAEAKADVLEGTNSLFRERAELDARSLSLLALTMERTGRPSNGMELVRLLEGRLVRANGLASVDTETPLTKGAGLRRPVADAEPTAWALLAFLACDPRNAAADELAAWLHANRRGPAWRSTRDTAVAIEAIVGHVRSRGVDRAAGDVQVFVEGRAEPIGTIAFGAPGTKLADAPSTLVLPAEHLRPGKNRIVLRRRGPGRVLWSAFATAVEPVEGESIPAAGVLLGVSRTYAEFVAPPLPGQSAAAQIVPGWSVVTADKRPANWTGRPLAAAVTGEKVLVTLRVEVPRPMERLLVEDPLPAGFEVVPGSAAGPFDREERRDDRQAFFVSRATGPLTFTYQLQAIHPGTYRALPAQVRLMYEPEIRARSASHRLDVLRDASGRRAPSGDEITPDELWGRALAALGAKDVATARTLLESLLDRFPLLPEVQAMAWQHLLRIGVETGDAKLLVRAHEQATDRDPARGARTVKERRALADAYRGLGEHERALVLYRDLVRDLAAADFDAARAFDRNADPWRRRLEFLGALRRLPDATWVAEAELALADATAKLRAPLPAPPAADGARRRPTTSDAQPYMLETALSMYRSFQAHAAESPLAHEAGRAAVEVLREMRLQRESVAEGVRFLRRFPASPHLDDVTLLVARGQFDAGDLDLAAATAERLASGQFPLEGDPARTTWSPFRLQGIRLAAEIAHVRGDYARAAALYATVAASYPDAAAALAHLTERRLSLREVETAAVGEEPKIRLTRKNVANVDLEVYAVDFMILYAMRRDLSAMNRIDLSGIEPVKRWSVPRAGPEDFRVHTDEVSLPRSERGVYLVVARADGLDASSVVLVSDLEVSVQAVDGMLRVYTTDRRTGAPVPEVYVKVGNGAAIQAQGFSDARGVFECRADANSVSVVAEKDGNVALWRR